MLSKETEVFTLRQWEEQERFFQNVIKTSEVVAYDDLGTEAIRKLYVEDFPVIVVADCEGGYLYESAIKEYKKI